MAFYNQSDLIYKDYKTTAYPSDNPKITGKPDSTLFNRHEFWEVLYLINALAEEFELKQKASGHKIERMIREHLPSDIRSQENVRDWIRKNWQTTFNK